ncbi:MAG: nitroreductase family protein [Actinomycetota bacterium]
MEFRDVLGRRRMVRSFLPQPVPDDVVRRVLSTVRHVPTAGFSQGIDVILLDTAEQLRRFWRTTTPDDEWSATEPDLPPRLPPVIVLPFSDKRAYLKRYSKRDKAGLGMDVEEGWPVPYWDIDAAMAVMTILLSAVDEGLGGWFFGVFHGERDLLRDLDVPEGPRLLGAIGLGYPDPAEGGYVLRHRPLDDFVHRGRW